MPVLSAISYGPGVLALMCEGGIVSAVLSNSIYLQSEGGDLVGLVDSRRADGPITIRVSGLDRVVGTLKGVAGGCFTANSLVLNICDSLEIDMTKAVPWVPPAVTLTANNDELHEAIVELHSTICALDAKSGLGPLVSAMPVAFQTKMNVLVTSDTIAGDPVLRRAAGAFAALEENWEAGDAAGAANTATRLLGLGPGLTPSGDDALAGLIATLKWFEQDSERAKPMGRSIAKAVLKEAPICTTRLSAQLLGYAAQGLLYEPAMRLGAALLAGRKDSIGAAAIQLFEIGHTSGTDIAVGVLVGAMLCARRWTMDDGRWTMDDGRQTIAIHRPSLIVCNRPT